MGFYAQISKYYDYIFPVGESQLKFIKDSAGIPVKTVLDVACGSGGYSVELAKSGYAVTAVDVDKEMVNLASRKILKQDLEAKALVCDMKELELVFHTKFDCVFCIGNSIVHIGSKEEINRVLGQMYKLVQDNGVLILQIINFDRILKFGISELPTLENDEVGLKFVRKYEWRSEDGIISFNTILTVDNGKERFENSVELFPVTSGDLLQGLKSAGFEKINFYGDFNYSEYSENSFMLVVEARK